MNRRSKREMDRSLEKRKEVLVRKKKFVANTFVQNGYDNPFNEVFFNRSLGPFSYIKKGLKIAPLRCFKAFDLKIYHRYDTLGVSVGKKTLVIKKWSMRTKEKPGKSIGPFEITYVNGKENDKKS